MIYDVETTGLSVLQDHIISMACVVATWIDGKLVKQGTFDTLVHTNRPINPDATRVHGIKNCDLSQAPEFSSALNSMIKTIGSLVPAHTRTIWVAHNGSRFDDIIMLKNARRVNPNLFDTALNKTNPHGFMDTLKLTRALCNSAGFTRNLPRSRTGKLSLTLTNCYKAWVDPAGFDNAHDALADTLALFGVLEAIDLSIQQCLAATEKWQKYLPVLMVRAKENTVTIDTAHHRPKPVAGMSGPSRILCLSCVRFLATKTANCCKKKKIA